MLQILLVQKVIKLSLIDYEIFFTNLYSTNMIFAVNEIRASTCAFNYFFTLLEFSFLSSACM